MLGGTSVQPVDRIHVDPPCRSLAPPLQQHQANSRLHSHWDTQTAVMAARRVSVLSGHLGSDSGGVPVSLPPCVFPLAAGFDTLAKHTPFAWEDA